MIREFFAIGMMEYGGIGLLIVMGLFVAALDLARVVLLPSANRSRISQHPGNPKPILPSLRRSERSQTNQ